MHQLFLFFAIIMKFKKIMVLLHTNFYWILSINFIFATLYQQNMSIRCLYLVTNTIQ